MKKIEPRHYEKELVSDATPFGPDDLALQPTCSMPLVEPNDLSLQPTSSLSIVHDEQKTKKQFISALNKQRTPLKSLPGIEKKVSSSRQESQHDYDWSVALIPTLIMSTPVVMEDIALTPTLIMPIPVPARDNKLDNSSSQPGSNVETLRKLLKSSGIYALASVATPLITLGLSPFLARHLSPSEYGAFTIINTFVSLMAGITQLGLGSAFFRAYSYDYSGEEERRDVLATVNTLLSITSIATVIIMCISASWLATFLFGQSSFSTIIYLGAVIVLLQNLTVPGFSWLRAENKPLLYSLLSISNLLISLATNLVLVGIFSFGLTGAVLGLGSGYAFVTLCVLPIVLKHAGVKIRLDIARNLLSFGLPLVLNVISYWALQVLDRYLLHIFGSLAQTSEYSVAYSLGSAISIVVISPFTLAWPTAMFTIAKRKDAARVFQGVFRLFGFFLLLAAFGLSLMGKLLLYLLFPPVYHAAAFVIPIVSVSLAFYGLYYIVTVGLNIKRKTVIISTFSTVAAVSNLALNLVLIPTYGAMGAAVATLLAYIVLALVAYIVNQRIYPLPFEVGKFALAFLLGVALYWGSDMLSQSYPLGVGIAISVCAFLLYGIILTLAELLPLWHKKELFKIYRRPS